MKLFRKTPEDLKVALGQCFWIGINGTTAGDAQTTEIFRTFQPGGFILFQRNVESLNQVRSLNAALQAESAIPLFTAIDQEGGSVERLHELIGSIPPAMAVAASGSRRLARQLYYYHARILRHLGFNVNFTPVLDLALTDADNGLGTRCFSDQPRIVVQYARAAIEAHHKAGVLTSGKHFPGLGDTNLDSHVDLPEVGRSWKQLLKEDLLPYKKLLNELPFIMVNHALYKDRNDKLPASLAPEIVTEFLLNKWNYNGLSISDDLNMGAVSQIYNLPEAAENAVLAGNHMFLVCKPEGVPEAYSRLLSRAKRNDRLASMIFRNAARIFAQKFALPPEVPARSSLEKDIRRLQKYTEAISQRAITALQDGVAAKVGSCTIYLPRTKWLKGNASELGNYFRKQGAQVTEFFYPIQVGADEAEKLAAGRSGDLSIVIVTNLNRNQGQKRLLDELLRRKKDVFVIQGHYPIDLLPANLQAAVASYWTGPSALKAAALALTGKRKPHGNLPLKSRKPT